MKTGLNVKFHFYGKVEFFVYFIIVVGALFLFKNNTYQIALPYYLSASNFYVFGDSIQYSDREVKKFHRMHDGEHSVYNKVKGEYSFSEYGNERESHEVRASMGNTVSYGFIYYVKLAKLLFGKLGDMNSVILMNSILHLTAAFFLISCFQSLGLRVLALLLYGANPFIIHLATYPFYYYPQIISSLTALLLVMNQSNSRLVSSALFVFLISAVFIRPTLFLVPFFVLWFLFLFYRKKSYLYGILVLLFFTVLVKVVVASDYSPWFTAYVGLGAYPNEYDIELIDNAAEKYIEQSQSEHFHLSRSKNEIIKDGYLDVVEKDPLYVVFNAFKNTLATFGFGYKTNNMLLVYLSIVSGSITLVVFTYYKLYYLIGLILFQNATYVFYYPPIPAYMAGSYILLIFGWLLVLEKYQYADKR